MEKPSLRVYACGQSIWLDGISRPLLRFGGFTRLVEEDGVRGVAMPSSSLTTVIGETDAYDATIATLARQSATPRQILERLAVADLQVAADPLHPSYVRSVGFDGFVSLAVAPELAGDGTASLAEARRLWAAVDRPNALVAMPATTAGIAAIRAALVEGINVNATLLFSGPRYETVAAAYAGALEQRLASGQPVDRLRSVASFDLGHLDTAVDRLLDGRQVRASAPADATFDRSHCERKDCRPTLQEPVPGPTLVGSGQPRRGRATALVGEHPPGGVAAAGYLSSGQSHCRARARSLIPAYEAQERTDHGTNQQPHPQWRHGRRLTGEAVGRTGSATKPTAHVRAETRKELKRSHAPQMQVAPGVLAAMRCVEACVQEGVMACIAYVNTADPDDREYVHQDSWPIVTTTPQQLPSGRQVVLLDRRTAPPHEPFHGEHPVTYVVSFRSAASATDVRRS